LFGWCDPLEQLAFLTFAMVLLVAVISPGPAIAALVARIMARGTDGIVAFCAGLVLGDLIWLSCAMFGLAALAALFQPVFLIVKYVGAAYLLFLAWKLWRDSGAPVQAEPVRGQGRQLFGAALLLSLGNPKIMLFYLALMPTVIDLTRLSVIDMAELAAIVAVVVSVVLAGYVLLAARARRMFTSPRAVQIVNRTAGLAMAGAAATIVARN
jgi:threonine/homoserine/homoserine lactone efflux protein